MVNQYDKEFKAYKAKYKLADNAGETLQEVPYQSVIDYKALAKRSGLMRKYDVKVGIIGSNSTIGQAAQAIGSMAIPGNLSPLRSPVRSAGWSALTPGKPNIPGGLNAGNAWPDPHALATSANAQHSLHRLARNVSTTVAGVRGLKHQRVKPASPQRTLFTDKKLQRPARLGPQHRPNSVPLRMRCTYWG
jgi:hypothetical protein